MSCAAGGRDDDTCACRPCTCPNGLLALLVAQILLLCTSGMSWGALMDCHFVTVNASFVDDNLSGIFGNLTLIFNNEETTDSSIANRSSSNRRGLGFFFFEDASGICTLDVDWQATDLESYFDDYVDVLGSDWEGPRAFASTAAVSSGIFFFWLLLFCCIAHCKSLRYIVGILILGLVAGFQGAAFMLLSSDFCSENDCQLGRSGKYGIAATVLAFCAGVAVIGGTRGYSLPGSSSNVVPGAYDMGETFPAAAASSAHHYDDDADYKRPAYEADYGMEDNTVPDDVPLAPTAPVEFDPSLRSSNAATVY